MTNHCISADHEKWGRLEADLSNADTSSLVVHPGRNGRKSYYRIPYKLRFVIERMQSIWELDVDLPGVKTFPVEANLTAAFAPGVGS